MTIASKALPDSQKERQNLVQEDDLGWFLAYSEKIEPSYLVLKSTRSLSSPRLRSIAKEIYPTLLLTNAKEDHKGLDLQPIL